MNQLQQIISHLAFWHKIIRNWMKDIQYWEKKTSKFSKECISCMYAYKEVFFIMAFNNTCFRDFSIWDLVQGHHMHNGYSVQEFLSLF